jgi:hypothetical protein
MFYIVGYVKSGRHLERDRAHYELFAWVDEEKIFQRPTYKSRYCFVLHATKVLKNRTFNVVIYILALTTTIEQYQPFVIRSVSPLPYKLGSPYLVHTSMMKGTYAYLFAIT